MTKRSIKFNIIFVLILMVSIFSGCTKVSNYSFVDYGSNTTTNEIVFSSDKKSLAWVFQDSGSDIKMNRIFAADKNGLNKTELISVDLEENKALRIMGYYPELGLFVYAIEYKNPEFGPQIQREAFFKFFNEENAQSIGRDYLSFFIGDKGVMGLRVGDVLAYYQISMKNTYAIDSRSNYNKETEIKAAFTDAKLTSDKKRLVYTFEYEPNTQGYNQNKILVSDFYGTNRKELIASEKPLEILEIIEDKQIRIKVGDEEKVLDL